MTPRDRVGGPSGRRKVAGDAVHRQNFSTPADGPHTRPQRRLAKAFGRRRARFAMPRIATQRTLRAENLGKPARRVMISAPWYYRFGPFSFALYWELGGLRQNGYITDEEDRILSNGCGLIDEIYAFKTLLYLAGQLGMRITYSGRTNTR